MAGAPIIHILAVMNYTFRGRLLRISAAISPIFLTTPLAMAASTALWVANPGVTATTNWSDLANWSTTPVQNDAKFGGTGSAGDLDTVTSFVDANQAPLSLQFTNNSLSPSLQFHNAFIPAGVTLSVGNGSLTVGGITADSYRTQVKITGGGTLLVTNGLTIGNNGSTASDQQTRLDLSGLTNFVYNAPAATITMGSGNRSAGDFTLAANSNYITAATWNANIASSSSGVSGTLNFGTGTNIINVSTFPIGGNRGNCTVNLPPGAGLRLRGTGGTDSDRVTMTLGNHNASGTGSTAAGTLNFNGATVDLKLGTLTMGQSGGNTTGGTPNILNPGNGTLNFDTGVVDVNAINMAIANLTVYNTANGTINIGPNAKLIVGAGGISMVNMSGPVTNASGTLTINGGTNLVAGNIRKTSVGGTATINVNAGTLTLVGSTNVIGVVGNPIDNVNLTDSKLTLPVNNGGATIVASNFNALGSTDTITISSLPGIGSFPTQLPVISYIAFNGNYDFVLGPLPGTYQGYLSNNTAGFSIDLVITNSLVKTDTWRGNVNGNWDTTTLNWFSGGPANYLQGDLVVFDDTLTGTPNVNLTTTLLPQAIAVNNSSATYVFSGTGKLSGTTSLNKSGTGTLTLAGTGGDDFTGGIIVNGGTVILDNTNATIAGGLNIISGTVQIGNNDGKGTLPSGGISDDGVLAFNATNNLTVGTAITGGGALVQKGSGKVTLTGANLYTGSTVVSNGTLALSGAGDLSSSLQLIVNNSALDLSALSQQRILNAFNVTNSTTTLAVIGGVTNISSANTTSGGAGNVINVTAIPPIASYPVSFGVIQSAGPIGGNFNFSVGTLPAANPPYAANVTQSPDLTTVLVTITAGPVGTRPSVLWTGADLPNSNTNWSDRLNWQLPGAPAPGDNLFFNNTGTAVASALSSPGGGPGAFVPDFINNIVDANTTISSLTYTNLNGTYHNTLIANGVTLSITNSGLSIGSLNQDVGGANSQFVTISGTNGKLNVSNTNALINVALTSASSGNHLANLDLSALGTFQANINRFGVGSLNTTATRPSGIAYLAQTNFLTMVYSVAPGFGAQSDLRGLGVGNQSDSTTKSFLYLGQTNVINVNTIGIGVGKQSGQIQFNPALTAANANPVLYLRGSDGVSPVTWWTMGDALAQTGPSSAPNGTADFSGGTINAQVGTMYVGRAPDNNNTGTANCIGVLTFDSGVFNAGTLIAGFQPRAIGDAGVGTVNVSSNATLGAGATLIVSGNLTLGSAAGGGGAANTSGTLNITNGTVLANDIVPGTNSSISKINLAGGRLVVTNAIGDLTAPLGSLTLASLGTPDNSRTTLNVPVGYDGLAGATVASLNIDALDTTTNVINIESVGPAAAVGVELPIIQYQMLTFLAGATFNIGLGTLPAGYTGVLTNDTASSTVGLVLTSMIHPHPQITALGQSGNTLTISGVNGFANGPFHVLASTDVSAPLNTWTSVGTGIFGPTGNFSFNATMDPAKPQQFFIVQVP
jgi:fibronectin-binding autotransporter adhesin